MYKFLFLLIYLLSTLGSAKSLQLVDQRFYTDSTNILELEDILTVPDSIFSPISQGYIMAHHHFTYWVKFKIEGDLSRDTVLFVKGGRISKFTLYIPDSLKRFQEHYGGVNIPYYKKDFPTNRGIVSLPTSICEETLYLKFKTEVETGVAVSFTDLKSVLDEDIRESWFGLFFMGAFFIVIFYNLIIFLFNREWLYLYYSLYAFSFLWYMLVALGIFNDRFPFTELDYFSYSIPYSLSAIFLILYTRSFFDTPVNEPLFDKILICCGFFKIGISVIYAIFDSEVLKDLIKSPGIDAALVVLCLVVGTKRYLAGAISARPFVLGFTILAFAYCYHGLDFAHNEMIGFVCALVDIFIFSFALSERYRLIKKEMIVNLNLSIEQLKENEILKERLNTQLDMMVSQRTEQLHKQTNEIRRMYDLLEKNSLKLESELKGESEARLMQKKMSYKEFLEFYPNDLFCYKMLSETKWHENQPYICKKCGYAGFTLMENYAHKCNKCTSIESATAHTLFHNMKFPLVKAFFILYQTSFGTIETTIEKSSSEIELRPATYWNFKQKVESIMASMSANKRSATNWISVIDYSIENFKKNK